MCFKVLLQLIRANVPDEVASELRQRFPNGPFGHYLSDQQLHTIRARRTNTPAPTASTAARPQPSVAPDEPAIPAIVEPRPGDEFPVEELGPRLAMVVRAGGVRLTGAPVGLAAMAGLTTSSPDDATTP